jgi:hypothetical protein
MARKQQRRDDWGRVEIPDEIVADVLGGGAALLFPHAAPIVGPAVRDAALRAAREGQKRDAGRRRR